MTANTMRRSDDWLPASTPSFWAAAVGLLASLCMLGLGLTLFGSDGTTTTLNVALIVVALVEGAASFYALQRIRVAWAFALSTNGTACVVMLFSAPRIRDAAEVSIALALVPCLLFGFIVLLYSLKPEDFSS